MTVLAVDRIGKAYRRYASEWLRFARWLGARVSPLDETWVLRNISFQLQPGEAVGIVGQNGAGKSTLLKILTGTLAPTEGTVQVHGRVGAILELGMGFNGELTGRQNAIHAAGLMGHSPRAIAEKIPEIESFAEIGPYFDEPMRTYSSGMQMRVAFAVATAWQPQLLIVDEALSVGDAYFQHRSFDRIQSLRKAGTSLLLVSHDRGAIQALCDRALLLDKGLILKDGEPQAVMDYYNALIAEKDNATIETEQQADGLTRTRSGTGEARVVTIGLFDEQGKPIELVAVGQAVELRVEFEVHQALPQLVFGYSIKDRLGQLLFGTNTWHTEQVLHDVQPGQVYELRIRFRASLGPGSYSIQTALVDRDTHLSANYEWIDHAFLFRVMNLDKPYFLGYWWSEPMIDVRLRHADPAALRAPSKATQS